MTVKESDRDIWERGKETDKHRLVERMIQIKQLGAERETDKNR
jgi:hypothetical protein